jgi:tetratricopeptide (TPR) repeat protein
MKTILTAISTTIKSLVFSHETYRSPLLPDFRMRILFSMYLLFCLNFSAQNKSTDSISLAIERCKPDTNKVILLNQLVHELIESGDYTKARLNARTSFTLANHLGFSKGIAESIKQNGSVEFWQGDYAKAAEDFLKALKIAETIGENELMASCYDHLGLVYKFQGDFAKAIFYYRKAIQIRESRLFGSVRLSNFRGLVSTYNNLGTAYCRFGNSQALDGSNHSARQQYDSATLFSLKSLAINKKIDMKNEFADSYNNLGLVHYFGEDYDSALIHFQISLNTYERISHKWGMARSLSYVGMTMIKLKQFDQALPYEEKALYLAKEIGAREVVKDVYMMLAEIFSTQSDFKKAYENLQLYGNLKDSLMNRERVQKISRLQSEYENEKSEVLSREQKRRQVLWMIIIVTVAVAMAVVSLVVIRSLKIAKRQKKIIERQKASVEVKQKEILDSIYYARRIQRALITNEKYIERNIRKLNS